PLDWNNVDFQGLPALRAHILREAGLDLVCTPADVLITAGAAEANFLAVTQLIQPGDEIIAESPGWPQPFVLAKGIPATLKTIQRREAAGWRLDLDRLSDLVTPKTKLIFLTNPNNPTGQLLSEVELHSIVEIADRVGAYLLVDEVYAGLEWVGERPPSIAGLYERGITTGSVSKALGLQGLRTGWMICRDREVIFDGVILRENSSEIMNIMGELIAEIAMRPDRYVARLSAARQEGFDNLKTLRSFIDGRPEVDWVPPQAGLIGLARLNLAIDGETFARRLLSPPYKTFVLPGSAYHCPQHIRLGVGGGAAVNLELGLARMAACLDELAT
ncbi:MAG: aminotransferase class I/II-fold pyridoxal phosphate-dependent enzyme, partial [Chloroflexota bacterium]